MMAAWILTRSQSAREGLQPFDPRRDLRQVAELVGSVFAEELGANGRGALQEMRVVGQFSPVLGNLMSLALFENFVSGYVWISNGRVVGNVTLQRADAGGARWRISNVAVAPNCRRRGIGRELITAALREIAFHGGSWAVLQVRTDNPIARQMYESLSFTDVCRDGIWKLPLLPDRLPNPDPGVRLDPLRVTAWQERFDLAQSARSSLAHWVSPLYPVDYQAGVGQLLGEFLGRLTGIAQTERWGVREGAKLLGAVETRASITSSTHSLRFTVQPQARGQLESVLIAQGLRSLAGMPKRTVITEHSGDHAEGVAALEAAGFRAQRVLLTMRRPMSPADTEL
jgi:ribosomal protein S18 acetylase RimI-like enzyme